MSRILFADGEPHIRQLCLEELQDEGYEVKVTGQAAEVVRLVDSFQPDMVIMEVVLPDMSGLETGSMIKGYQPQDPGHPLFPLPPPSDLSSWGADDFVLKSPNLDSLKATVRQLTARITQAAWRNSMAIMEISVVPVGLGDPQCGRFCRPGRLFAEKSHSLWLTDMGTLIRRPRPSSWIVAQVLHELPFEKGVNRVVTHITIDDRRDKNVHLGDKIKSVKARLT